MWVSKLFEVDFSNLNEVPWNRAPTGFRVYSTSARPISAFRKPRCLTMAHQIPWKTSLQVSWKVTLSVTLHILPSGLVRIRHYGILGNNRRKRDIEAARAILQRRGRAVELESPSVADKPMCCPLCGKSGIRWSPLLMPWASCT